MMTDEKIGSKDESIYQQLISNSRIEMEQIHGLSDEGQKKIIQSGKNRARMTNIMISLACLLFILPVLTLGTYLYYAIGGRANHLMDVAAKTIYVTEPNMSVEEMELEEDIGIFSMDIMFDVFKRIGSEDYKAGEYSIHFYLDQPNFPKKEWKLDRPLAEVQMPETEVMVHPKNDVPFDTQSQWDLLKGLPDGTVSEVYLSFSKIMRPKEVEELLSMDVESRWYAVNSGLESKGFDKEGLPVSPIGYPSQIDTTTWSPFNGRESNEKVFLDILKLLAKKEEVAVKVARAKSLNLDERISYIEKNGIEVYGAVVTGPTAELRKLEQIKDIRAMKVGEVKLWNWE
jgi:hypothetical protein